MPKAKKVKNQASEIAKARGLECFGERARTIVTSFKASARTDLDARLTDRISRELQDTSLRIGTTRSIVGVFLNCVADSSPSFENCQLLFDTVLHTQLWRRLLGLGPSGHGRPPEDLLAQFPWLKNLLNSFVTMARERVGGEQALASLGDVPSGVRNYASQEMFTSLEQQVSSQRFTQLAIGHIACALERAVFTAFPEDRAPSEKAERSRMMLIARKMFWSFGEHRAHQSLKQWIGTVPGRWRTTVFNQVFKVYYKMFEGLRFTQKRSPLDVMRGIRKNPVEGIDLYLPPLGSAPEEFRFNLEKFHAMKLWLLTKFRESDEPLQSLRLSRLDAVDEYQPKIFAKRTPQGYTPQCFHDHIDKFKEVPVPDWMTDGRASVSDADVKLLYDAVKKAREEEWERQYQPGLVCLSKPFALFPLPSVRSAFVHLNAATLTWIGLRACKASNLKYERVPERVWWTSVFDFHGRRSVRLKPLEKRRKLSRKQKRRRYKPLRQRSRWNLGIPMLYQDAWNVSESPSVADLSDRSKRMPWFVQSITTNGLEVHVTLTGFRVRNSPKFPAALNDPIPSQIEKLPTGVADLNERGYSHVTKKCRPGRDTKGIFSEARKLRQGLKIEAVGVDPGHVKLIAQVQTSVESVRGHKETPDEIIKKEDLKSSYQFLTSAEYRKRSGRDFQQRFETRRRAENPRYKRALEELNSVTMKRAGVSSSYAYVFLTCLRDLVDEMGTQCRRKVRFFAKRCQMRVVHKITDTIAYGNEQNAVWKSRKRGKEKRHMARELRSRPRVVFFGDGQFPHGSHGPLPRKKILRCLAFKCPVVLTGEFRTSKYCHICNTEMGSEAGSRVLRCTSTVAEGGPCPGNGVDRDLNGAANILKVGLCHLLGLPRPDHLSRGNNAVI